VVQRFWVMTLLLFLLVAAAGVHYLRFDRQTHVRPLQNLASLTHRSALSLGQAYYESSTAYGNIVYPEMPVINRMDFVYAK